MNTRPDPRQHDQTDPQPSPGAGLPRIELRWDESAVSRLAIHAQADGQPCPVLASLASAAAQMLDAPCAAVTLVDRDSVRILAAHGVDIDRLDRPQSFCGECASTAKPLIVEDAASDPRFRSSPLVAEAGVGHYIGVPLIGSCATAIGTLCVFGPGKRSADPQSTGRLSTLAAAAVRAIEQKRLLIEHDAQRDLCLGVLDASMDGICTLSELTSACGRITDFRITMMNARAEQLLSATADRTVGRRLAGVFPRVRENGLLDRLATVAESGEPQRFELLDESPHRAAWFEVSAVRIPGGVAVTFAGIDDRKQAEAQLKINKDRFLMVSAATEDMVWDYDARSGRLWWSENFSLCLGHSVDEIEEHLDWWAEKLHPDDREATVASFDAALHSDHTNWSAHYRIRRADGSYATVLDRASIMRDHRGEPIRAVGAIIDLSARLQAGRDIEFQRTILEAQAEATQDAVLVTDASHRAVRANHRFHDIVGAAFQPGASYAAIRACYENSVNAEQVNIRVRAAIDDPWLTIKEEIEFRDGRAVELHSEPLRQNDGTFLGRVWFVRDLTRQRQSSQILRAHNLVLEASGIVLFRWRPEPGWPVALVSRNVEQFGYTPDDLLSGDILFTHLVHHEDLPRVTEEVERYIAEGRESFEQEYRIVCRDGSSRWIYDKTVVDRAPDGTLVSLHGVILDITERRRVERELAASEAMLKELTSQIPGAVYQYRHRPDGTAEIPYISEGVCAICGVTPQ